MSIPKFFRRACVAALLLCLLLPLCLAAGLADTSSDSSASSDVSASSDTTSDEKKPFAAINPAAAYCVSTGQMLYTNRGGEKFSPGVLTKLASLMVAHNLFNDCGVSLKTEVTVKGSWVNGSYTAGDRSSPYLGLADGERYTLEYLFATSLVANANDACAATVHAAMEQASLSEADFLERMNRLAEELGMTDTRFEDTVGYRSMGYTTAADAARLAGAFYMYDDLVKLSNSEPYGRIHNKNYLKSGFYISDYVMSDAIGLIAGQATNQGNYCVVTACEKEGVAYTFVVLGASGERLEDGERWFDAGNAYEDIRGMIPHVMASYGLVTVCKADDIISELRMGKGAENDFLLLVPEKAVEMMVADVKTTPITVSITYDADKVYESELNGKVCKTVDPPVKQGDVLGSVTYRQGDRELATVQLVAKDSVGVDSLKDSFAWIHEFLFEGSMGVIVKITLGMIGLWLFVALAAWVMRIVRHFRNR